MTCECGGVPLPTRAAVQGIDSCTSIVHLFFPRKPQNRYKELPSQYPLLHSSRCYSSFCRVISLHDQRILKYEYVKPQNFKYGKPLIKKELAGGNGYNCLKACLLRNRPVVRVFVLSVEYSY